MRKKFKIFGVIISVVIVAIILVKFTAYIIAMCIASIIIGIGYIGYKLVSLKKECENKVKEGVEHTSKKIIKKVCKKDNEII